MTHEKFTPPDGWEEISQASTDGMHEAILILHEVNYSRYFRRKAPEETKESLAFAAFDSKKHVICDKVLIFRDIQDLQRQVEELRVRIECEETMRATLETSFNSYAGTVERLAKLEGKPREMRNDLIQALTITQTYLAGQGMKSNARTVGLAIKELSHE